MMMNLIECTWNNFKEFSGWSLNILLEKKSIGEHL